jgi:putative FmdB family regulatory protein
VNVLRLNQGAATLRNLAPNAPTMPGGTDRFREGGQAGKAEASLTGSATAAYLSALAIRSIMPTYEYICSKCDTHFDLVQSMKENPLSVCPKDQCGQKKWGKGKVKRAIGGGAGLIFKGTGFYITDYRSDSYKEAAKKDAPPASAPAKDNSPSGTSEPKTPKTNGG